MITRISSTDRSGFSAEMTGAQARRQLRLSVAVVTMIGVGIVSAALSVGPQPIAAKRDAVSTVPTVTLRADTAVSGAKAI